MGVVYQARDLTLERPVAVKVLRPEAATASAAARFLREARLLAKLQHPRVVQVHQAGEADGLFYIVMDLVQGESLAARLRQGPLSPAEAETIGGQLVEALAAVHQVGILHRDVKPGNIFLRDDGALLGDFGIARSDESAPTDEPVTAAGASLGTPGYMAPEVWRGERATPASDLYSLGMVLYECLTGRRWTSGADPSRAEWTSVPARWRPALARALAMAAPDRFPDAEAFRAALASRRPRRTTVIALALAAALGAAAVMWPRGGPDLTEFGAAVPGSASSRRALAEAEGLYAGARWTEAARAYGALLAADSSCLLCAFRMMDVDRWLGERPNRDRLRLLSESIHRFPPLYQQLIQADLAERADRLEVLSEAARSHKGEYLAFYYLGSELFNRGPLFGRRRHDAIVELEKALTLRPDFAPPQHELTLALIADGDSAGARPALERIRALPEADGLAEAQRLVAEVAFGFRFDSTVGTGLRTWAGIAQDTSMRRLRPILATGPRVLAGLGTPEGAVALGRAFEDAGDADDLRLSGLVAQAVGFTAMGQLTVARETGDRLRRAFPGRETDVFLAQLHGMTAAFDDAASPWVREAEAELESFLGGAAPAPIRHRAAWLVGVLAARAGQPAVLTKASGLLRDEPEPRTAALLLTAWDAAIRGRYDSAIAVTNPIVRELGRFEGTADPFLRAGVMLSRAEWKGRLGDGAREELRWPEHFHLDSYPVAQPLSVDGDWAMATFAAWRMSELAGPAAADEEICAARRLVAQHWGRGDQPYQSRAIEAGAQARQAGCAER
jgi:serine/threonine protein kinase